MHRTEQITDLQSTHVVPPARQHRPEISSHVFLAPCRVTFPACLPRTLVPMTFHPTHRNYTHPQQTTFPQRCHMSPSPKHTYPGSVACVACVDCTNRVLPAARQIKDVARRMSRAG
jgi:hypothetical protein